MVLLLKEYIAQAQFNYTLLSKQNIPVNQLNR